MSQSLKYKQKHPTESKFQVDLLKKKNKVDNNLRKQLETVVLQTTSLNHFQQAYSTWKCPSGVKMSL